MRLGREIRVATARSAPEHRRRRGTAGQRVFERQRSRAESAFGRQAADDPVRASAPWAVIDFAVVIDGVIPPRTRVESRSARLDRAQHRMFLRNHFEPSTSVESLCFIDDPCLRSRCHSGDTHLFHCGTKREELFRGRDDRFSRLVDINHCLANPERWSAGAERRGKWSPTSVITAGGRLKTGWQRSAQ